MHDYSSDTPVLLQQVRILDPLTQTDCLGDVLLAHGRIEAIETHWPALSPEIQIIDAQGWILAPGLVDLYSYSGEPGHEERETLASLMAAAAAGGFTQIAISPQTIPAIDHPATVDSLQQKVEMLKKHLHFSTPSVHYWGALTVGVKGQQMTELGELVASGVVGLTDGCPLGNLGLLRRILEYVKPFGKPLALVPILEELRSNGVMREGILSMRYGLLGDPHLSETTAIAALLEMIEAIPTPVHFLGVSTRRGVELITQAKDKGMPVTASTPWMNLLLDTKDVGRYNPNLRLDPPLGNESDRLALIAGVKAGIIDTISINHRPYTYEEKTVAFGEAPPGAIALELVLPLLWQELVVSGEWTGLKLWEALSTNPRSLLKLPPRGCQVGQEAELILFDPQQTWTVTSSTLHSHSLNTPWLGKELTGKVVRIWHCC